MERKVDSMMAGGEDDDGLGPFHELLAQISLAAISASDLDYAFQLQLDEAIQASLRGQSLNAAAAAAAASAPSSSQAAPAPLHEPPSDFVCALALQAAELDRAEQVLRDAETCRAAAAASAFVREVVGIPEDRWAEKGDIIERAVDSSAGPHFRIFSKGMASKDVVGPRDRDPGVAVLAVAVCGSLGEPALRIQKPVDGAAAVGDRMTLELMALTEGLDTALGLGIRNVTIVTDYRPLHNHMLGISRPTGEKLLNMFDRVLSMQKEFEQCETSLVEPNQVSHVTQLARDYIDAQIAKALAEDACKVKRETCSICLEDTDISKIHVVEGCAHRFCLSCMKEHVKSKLCYGMLPACPQDGCTTKLTVEGSMVFLSPQMLEIMVQRVREEQIPPSQKIYCPYPKCSALMSFSDVICPMQDSSSKYTVADVATLRKCVKCRGSFCISCKVPWHDELTCYDYKRRHPHALPEDARLQTLAQQRLWRQCVKCKHMIELAQGCYHMTCVCGHEFCYRCGKEWKDKRATCSCLLWDENNIIEDS